MTSQLFHLTYYEMHTARKSPEKQKETFSWLMDRGSSWHDQIA